MTTETQLQLPCPKELLNWFEEDDIKELLQDDNKKEEFIKKLSSLKNQIRKILDRPDITEKDKQSIIACEPGSHKIIKKYKNGKHASTISPRKKLDEIKMLTIDCLPDINIWPHPKHSLLEIYKKLLTEKIELKEELKTRKERRKKQIINKLILVKTEIKNIKIGRYDCTCSKCGKDISLNRKTFYPTTNICENCTTL